MQASIRTQQNGSVVAVLDADAARVTFACVMFAARFHDEIVPLAMRAIVSGTMASGLTGAMIGLLPVI